MEDISGSIIDLPEDTAKHCVQVLRMKEGERMLLTDGRGNVCTAVIKTAAKKSCTVICEDKSYKPRGIRNVSIAISPVKNTGRFEWFLEKAAEIGVQQVIPLICLRTEKQHLRNDRLKNILVAAMLQSQQAWLPELTGSITFGKLVSASTYKNKLIAHCAELRKSNISQFNNGDQIQILIGPEGDFSPDEIELALATGFQPVSLGITRLRTETAGIVAATLLINNI